MKVKERSSIKPFLQWTGLFLVIRVCSPQRRLHRKANSYMIMVQDNTKEHDLNIHSIPLQEAILTVTGSLRRLLQKSFKYSGSIFMPSKRHLHNHLNDFPKDQISCITTSHVTESERGMSTYSTSKQIPSKILSKTRNKNQEALSTKSIFGFLSHHAFQALQLFPLDFSPH